MQKISTNAKQTIIEKALTKDGRRFIDIAKDHNISVATLNRWLKSYRENGTIEEQKELKENRCLLMSERFQHLIATASLDEVAIGVYCREQGIYSFQLTEWKEAFMTQPMAKKQQSNLVELNALRAENNKLKQEVRRKDSALAEATALLILKKKASLIWGEFEED